MTSDLRSFAKALAPRLHRSGSSFRHLIFLLPPALRQSLIILYLYCRAVDDCADDGSGGGLARLQVWRRALDSGENPDDPVLARAVFALRQRYDLPMPALLAVIEGCQQDITNPLSHPSQAELDRYCDRVAGAVGTLILCLSGFPPSDPPGFAQTAGRALQYTNILRDLAEDRDRDRCYLPAGLAPEELAAEAGRLFRQCLMQRATLPRQRQRKMAAATGFILIYQDLLRELCHRGFSPSALRNPVRIPRWRLIRVATRTLVNSWR